MTSQYIRSSKHVQFQAYTSHTRDDDSVGCVYRCSGEWAMALQTFVIPSVPRGTQRTHDILAASCALPQAQCGTGCTWRSSWGCWRPGAPPECRAPRLRSCRPEEWLMLPVKKKSNTQQRNEHDNNIKHFFFQTPRPTIKKKYTQKTAKAKTGKNPRRQNERDRQPRKKRKKNSRERKRGNKHTIRYLSSPL